ncbi:DMT family transporter [Balneolales bacterium ANBcel1]|nr:DMT family transporter [Balneolales bacterium ANBcel1]
MSAPEVTRGRTQAQVPTRIYGMLAAGMIMFAFAPILVRSAGDADPLAFAAVRTVTAALVLLPFWWFRPSVVTSFFNFRDNLIAAGAGVMLGLHFIFWILAIQNTTIASASVLVTIHPVILILIEAGFFKRVFPPLVWIGVLVAFSGSVLLGYSDATSVTAFEHALLGDFYAVIAAVLFALYFLVSQKLRQKSDWINYVVRVYGFTGLTCLLAAIVAGSSFPMSPAVWLAGIGLALGPQIIGHGSMNYAVKYVAPTMLSMLILTEPVFATVLALILFSEMPPLATFPAMAIIIAGITMAWLTKKGK